VKTTGNVLIAVGLGIVAVGLAARYAPWLISWFGRLPGDIRIERDGTRIYIPIASMILLSIVASVLLAAIVRSR
jgi:uncharacterized membrane protein required for colicin V production